MQQQTQGKLWHVQQSLLGLNFLSGLNRRERLSEILLNSGLWVLIEEPKLVWNLLGKVVWFCLGSRVIIFSLYEVSGPDL